MIAHWRSLLFVPADDDRRIAGAHRLGADAIILDMEDAVGETAKPAARQRLGPAISQLVACELPVLVRINSCWRDVMADLDAAMVGGVAGIMAPKVMDPASLAVLSGMIGEFEVERGIAARSIRIVALIEHPAARRTGSRVIGARPCFWASAHVSSSSIRTAGLRLDGALGLVMMRRSAHHGSDFQGS